MELKLHCCQFGGAVGGFCAETIIVQESEFVHCCRLEARWRQTLNIITWFLSYAVAQLRKISRDSFCVKMLKSNQLPGPTHFFGILGRRVGRSQRRRFSTSLISFKRCWSSAKNELQKNLLRVCNRGRRPRERRAAAAAVPLQGGLACAWHNCAHCWHPFIAFTYCPI